MPPPARSNTTNSPAGQLRAQLRNANPGPSKTARSFEGHDSSDRRNRRARRADDLAREASTSTSGRGHHTNEPEAGVPSAPGSNRLGRHAPFSTAPLTSQAAEALGQASYEALCALIATIAALSGAGCILIDPPWRFIVRSPKGEGRSACQHYNTRLSLTDLARLPVSVLAAPDCWLFLWTTWPMLPSALWLIEQWGFRYSSDAFLWAKLNPSGIGFAKGLGLTTRKNTEPCLLGRRGNPRRLSKNVDELIVSPRRAHSQKPDQQYERIEAFCVGPRVELFARQRWPGWFAWGDQLDHFAPKAATTSSEVLTRNSGCVDE